MEARALLVESWRFTGASRRKSNTPPWRARLPLQEGRAHEWGCDVAYLCACRANESPGLERVRAARYGRARLRANACCFEAIFTPELATLPGPALELATGRAAILIDAAGMRRLAGTEMHACPLWRKCERKLTEMTRNEGCYQVFAACPLPTHEVLGRNEDAPIARLAT